MAVQAAVVMETVAVEVLELSIQAAVVVAVVKVHKITAVVQV
jgi:hypothetical protein